MGEAPRPDDDDEWMPAVLDCHTCGRGFVDRADTEAGQAHVFCWSPAGCGGVHGRRRGDEVFLWPVCPTCAGDRPSENC